jgi:DtxR family Mn-dependent transcriptional regulator
MESNNNTSESEQMYLLTIARLSEMVDECPIPISKVADVLGITPISANQMIHHLEQMEMITYTPYKGVEFTEIGWQKANQLLRIRRLWEVFLVEHLHYSPDKAETLACRLEHAIPPDTANRLDAFLGNPAFSPQGKPIPPSDSDANLSQTKVFLCDLSVGTGGTIVSLSTNDTEKSFLQQAGVGIGQLIEILGKQENGTCLVENHNQQTLSLSLSLAEKIQVKRIPECN